MKGVLDSIDYKLLWYKNGNLNSIPVELKGVMKHTSQEGVALENNTINFEINLQYKYPFSIGGQTGFTHQFVDPTTGNLILSDKDIIRVFVKYKDGSPIDITKRDDLLGDYFVKSWDIDSSARKISIVAVDINYKVFNRIWNGVYGVNTSGTATNISGNTLTDTSASWDTDQWKYRTLQMKDSNGVIYTYLILSNTATTLTVHTNITSGVTTDYLIGHSSASAIVHALKNVTTASAYTGSFDMIIEPTTNYGNNYDRGVQLLRPDGSAFPIIEFSIQRKPYFELLDELSSINAVNTEHELNLQEYTINRDMQYSVTYDSEKGKYRMSWFYVDAPISLKTGTVSSVSGTVVNVDETLSVDEYKGKIMRVNNKTYQIMSNSTNSFTLDRDASNIINVGDKYNILGNVDFVWDNDADFKQIHNYKFGNDNAEGYNHIYFSCGTNPLNDREIIGHKINERSESIELKDTFVPMRRIVREFLEIDGRFNTTAGKYEYPASYPYTPKWAGAKTVNSNAEYNAELKRVCRNKAYLKCEALFNNVKEGFLKGQIVIRGKRFIKPGEANPTNKIYSTGTRILFKHIKNGIVNKSQKNGYYYLRVKTVKHDISPNKWDTILDVEWDLYNELEQGRELNL